MPNRPSLGELLLRWQEVRQPPEVLCKDCPELLDELRKHIDAMQSMESFLKEGESRTSSQDLSAESPSQSSSSAPIPSSSRVEILVARWKLLHARGQKVSPEDLCRDCPELLDAVKKQIGSTLDGTQDFRVPNAPAAATIDEVRPPETLGRYRLEQLIGQGGFGEVWCGFDPELHRVVAIKRPRPDRPLSNQHVNLFLAEARKAASLKHPGLVPVHDVGQEGANWFIVSDFIEGTSLAAQIGTARPGVEQSVRIVAEVAEALHYAHLRGLVHRDIKPGNILLDRKQRAFLTDFGLAVSEDEQLEEKASFAGTPAYMAPEQVRGESNRVDARTDVYSLGMVLYELLTGRLPFKGKTLTDYQDQILHREPRPPRTIDDTLPQELERICLKCLAKAIPERFTTAKDLANELRQWLTRPAEARLSSPGAAPVPHSPAGIQRWHLLVMAGVLAIGLVLLVVPRSWVDRSDDLPKPASQEKPGLPVKEPQPGVWNDLLVRKPETLMRPKVVFKEVFDPVKKELWWDTVGDCMFRLGTATMPDYEVEITLEQTHLAGHRGLFLGCQPLKEEGKKNFFTCQLILLLPAKPPGPGHVLNRIVLIFNDKTARIFSSIAIGPMVTFPHKPPDRMMLAAQVKKGRLWRVYLNQIEVKGLELDTQPGQPNPLTGDFGVFADQDSCRLTSAQWRFEKETQP
jgi:serine/threonine protein kinase